MTVQDALNWLNEAAPFETAESFDNVGLLIGTPRAAVTGVLFGLDITEPLLEEALSMGANLIITHHPFLFHAVKRIDSESPLGRMLSVILANGLNVIAMHTNWDKAAGGVSETLAETIGLSGVRRGDDFLRIGVLPEAVRGAELEAIAEKALHVKAHLYGDPEKTLRSIAVAGGGYGEAAAFASDMGADALIVGEIKHHDILEGTARGLVILSAEHYATEYPGIRALEKRFSEAFPELSHKLHTLSPFGGAVQ